MTVEEANEGEIKELKDWLLERAADDDDVIVDELQEELWPQLEKKLNQEGIISGSEEYLKNSQEVRKKVEELKKPGSKESKPGNDGGKMIHDGRRRCRYKGGLDQAGLPHGEGWFLLKFTFKNDLKSLFLFHL